MKKTNSLPTKTAKISSPDHPRPVNTKTGLPLPEASKTKAVKKREGNSRQIAVNVKRLTQTKGADRQAKPQYDEEMEKRFDAMLEGKMVNLPPLPRSIVRIFISSTFSDMRAERNAISCTVAPILRNFCSALDLDLQLLDLRWGLTSDAQNDHSTEKLCLQEVENCQEVSLGPNFISLLSERYGFRPLPATLLCEEFEKLRSAAVKERLDVELLDSWYKRDDNAIPAENVLQPINSKFHHFGDQEKPDLALKDKDSWQEVMNSLLSVIRHAADSLHKEGKLSADQRHKYFKSVTEFETAKGVYEADSPKSHCLFYHRQLNGLTDKHLKEKDAHRYTSIVQEGDRKTIDKEISKLQANSVAKIQKILGENNCRKFEVAWKDGGIDPSDHPEHNSYIQSFCQQLTKDVKDMIKRAKEQRSTHIRQREYYTGFDEALHHLRFCQSKCESFCGQEKVLKAAKDYVLTSKTRKPLILWAESGAGKTSVMAMIMSKLSSWINGRHYSLIRFLGTSPETLNIQNVIFSVCGQLADNENIIMEPMGYKDIDALIDYFPRFLRTISTSFKDPVIIMLDSVDQLSSEDNAYSMNWLPVTLPQNVRLIISTLPREHKILHRIKKRLPEAENYVEVPLLSESTGKYLKLKHRKVTDDQMKMILDTFSKTPSPLYLKLLLDEAVKWSSFMPRSELQLAASIRAAIDVLFDRLEKKFGKVVVQSALGYITVGLNGLSEIELDDVLSCDDDVLDDLFHYHDPPVPGFVRIPPVLWARIRYDIKEYLVDRMAQNKTTMFWYHRQFIEAATDRYVQENSKDKLHLTLLEIYLAEKGVKKDIYLSHRKKEIKQADRQVTPQPLTVENMRKLKCIPYHLNRAAGSVSDVIAKGMVYCNIRYLSTKIAATSREEIVKNMDAFLLAKEDKEIAMVMNFLVSNTNDLTNPMVFAGSILAYLKPEDDSIYLKKMQQDANMFLAKCGKTLLIPVFPCLASREAGASTGTLLDDEKVTCFDVSQDSEIIVTGGSDGTVALWEAKTGRLMTHFDVEFNTDELTLVINNNVLLLNHEQKQLRAVNLETGATSLKKLTQTNVLSLSVSADKSNAFVITKESDVALHILDLRSESLIKTISLQKMFEFESLRTILSASEKYLVIQAKCTKKDYEAIKASWKKSGGFASQPHPYRFAAVDLTQDSESSEKSFTKGLPDMGNLRLCMRNLSKIPTLGVTVAPYQGHTMLLATRRHGIFWDIVSGKCDQMMSKGKKLTMIYRPDWAGEKCVGTNTCFVQPPSQKFVAVGSEDGYLIVYNFDSGLPVGMKSPPTRHSHKVEHAAVASNSSLVASVCEAGVLKLWSPKTGFELFSLDVGGPVKQMTFTPDSSHLVALRGGSSSRMIVFKVQRSK